MVKGKNYYDIKIYNDQVKYLGLKKYKSKIPESRIKHSLQLSNGLLIHAEDMVFFAAHLFRLDHKNPRKAINEILTRRCNWMEKNKKPKTEATTK